MSKTVTINISENLYLSLERESKIAGREKEELVEDMLKKKLLLASFERARKVCVPIGEAAGYITDDDVFRDIS